jgi:hypothetical protein
VYKMSNGNTSGVEAARGNIQGAARTLVEQGAIFVAAGLGSGILAYAGASILLGLASVTAAPLLAFLAAVGTGLTVASAAVEKLGKDNLPENIGRNRP